MDQSNEIPELVYPYGPVHEVEMGPDGPRSGVADYSGVRCRFRVNETSSMREYARGILCDLVPIDASQGPPLLADGRFRRGDGGALEVYWFYYGCPSVKADDPAMPLRFAEFLDRLVDGTATSVHWMAFIIQHYLDESLEEARRECGRILHGTENAFEAAQRSPYREQLLALAAGLRTR